ncbi:MAG: helix-turn-helix transcriptional regulator [Defluviitaleaceae bacterium]|nr:helix-turn-helix transcriptional regulator [Defluviitaleaceae bacterium]
MKNFNVNEDYNAPFSKRLRELLDGSSMTIEKNAEAIGVTRQTLSKWKDGLTKPDMISFKKLAEHFEVTLKYLYGDTNNKTEGNFMLGESLGLSDAAIEMIQELAQHKRLNNHEFPMHKIMSDVISHKSFKKFLEYVQLYINEGVRHEINKLDILSRNDDDWARLSEKYSTFLNTTVNQTLSIHSHDLSEFFKYNSIQAIEEVLRKMPKEYSKKTIASLMKLDRQTEKHILSIFDKLEEEGADEWLKFLQGLPPSLG